MVPIGCKKEPKTYLINGRRLATARIVGKKGCHRQLLVNPWRQGRIYFLERRPLSHWLRSSSAQSLVISSAPYSERRAGFAGKSGAHFWRHYPRLAQSEIAFQFISLIRPIKAVAGSAKCGRAWVRRRPGCGRRSSIRTSICHLRS